ncbi:MAG: hypothetical protein JWR44_268 [Hymenobacter sp.]|jgi:outer membrane protein OmpA-like peptidoglycan-associated protein|nr:hypothetical protein [Hymenobacter sp.]
MKRLFTFLPLLLALTVQAGNAQVATMSLMGNVQTDNQEALPGAAITVIHVPSGVRHAAASDMAGHFVVANLQPGGPYLMQVGEGGYRPQTLESIFLENGKTASFTVTLSKLVTNAKGKGNRAASQVLASSQTVASESAGSASVLTPKSSGSARSVPSPGGRRAGSRPFQPVTQVTAVAAPSVSAPAPAAPAAAPAPAPVVSAPASSGQVVTRLPSASPAAPASRYRRYPAYKPAPTKVSDPIVAGHFDTKTNNYVYETGAITTLKLADGNAITGVGINSTESFLYRFITNPQIKVDTMDLTQGWYNFDRVFFETGKATLTPESMNQLRNIASILKAYPKTYVKLGGYTDSTGSYKVNKLLSDARARTAWASLVEMGISPNRIEARGYGPRYSIALNNTDIGRAKNRRLSVKVLQK